MAKYYVQSGKIQSVIDRPNVVAAIQSVFKKNINAERATPTSSLTFVSEIGFLPCEEPDAEADKILNEAIDNSIKDIKNAPYYAYNTAAILQDLGLIKFYQNKNGINDGSERYDVEKDNYDDDEERGY